MLKMQVYCNLFKFLAINLILLFYLPITCCEPKVFNFQSKNFENSTSSNFRVASFNFLVKSYKSPNEVDYFRLIDYGHDYLTIGGADSLHNISIETFKNSSIYTWTPQTVDYDDCIMKTVDQNLCHNYIRIMGYSTNRNVILCGTNAYRPTCRILQNNFGKVLTEFPGTGLSPMDPRHNTTAYMVKDHFYAATVVDFSGIDSLIFRRNATSRKDLGLRTPRNNDLFLNKPQFVGILHSKEYVYFFFREEANEAESISTYSRVARVCKNDLGGPRNYYEAEWTTFVKARLNCSISEKNKSFYFDEIIAISNLLQTPDGRQIFYATFVSEFNFLRHSVICAFDLAEIDNLFAKSDILVLDVNYGSGKWTRKNRNELTLKVGQCQGDSRQISENDAIQLRKSTLMASSASNIFSRGAVGIHRGSDNYNQISILKDVQIFEGFVDILYVATDHGNIIKMVNLANFRENNNKKNSFMVNSDEDPLIPVAIYEVSKSPIRSLLIFGGKYLVVITNSVIYRLPLHTCVMHETCNACVSSRDPHCVWHNFECINLNIIPKKFAYQDVLAQKGNVCSDVAAKENREILPFSSHKKTNEALRIDVTTNSRRNDNYSNYYGSRKTPCDCMNLFASQKPENCQCLPDSKYVSKIDGNFISSLFFSSDKDALNKRNESSEFFGKLKTFYLEAKSGGGSLPWWVILIILLALFQTIGFIYLCCKLCSARRNSKKMSSNIVTPKIFGISKSNETVMTQKNCLAEPSNYTMYPQSSNYFASSGLINAYSPTPLFNPIINKGNHATSTMRPQKYKYSDIFDASANAMNSNKLCSVSQINVNLNNYAQNRSKDNNSKEYNEADERAAAMAIASMSLSRSVNRMNTFKNPPFYQHVNANEEKTNMLKLASLRNKSFGHTTDSGHGDSSAASNLSTMSASSDLIHVTALSSFGGEINVASSRHTSFRGEDENVDSGKEISIHLEGAASLTPGLQTFGTIQIPPLLSQLNANYSTHYDCSDVDSLQHQQRQAHAQPSLNGMIIRA